MAVKVGNSWVSETALTYAKAKSGSGTSVSLKALSDRYPGVNLQQTHRTFTERHKQYSDRTEYSGADAK